MTGRFRRYLVAAVLAGGAAAVALSARRWPQRAAPSNDGHRVAGLRATLLDQETILPDGRVSWWIRWHLCWDPMPDAEAYVVTYVSFEGAGRPRDVTDRCVALSVANGVTTRPGDRAGRAEQLALMAGSLGVRVAPRLRNGTLGRFTETVPVGVPYP